MNNDDKLRLTNDTNHLKSKQNLISFFSLVKDTTKIRPR